METNLVFKVDGIHNLYEGVVEFRGNSKDRIFKALVIALNTSEAIEKLKAYIAKEDPSFDIPSCAFSVKLEYVIQ